MKIIKYNSSKYSVLVVTVVLCYNLTGSFSKKIAIYINVPRLLRLL